ncbi:hypothetical protein EMCRGX_G014365 [Ephydatia muelleri]
MVRTRANNSAARKAVVAKAPRKQLAPAHVASPSGKSKKGGKHSIGGNPAKVWPTPAWQKGIADFLAVGEGDEGSPPIDTDAGTSTSAGPLTQSSSDSAEVCSQSSNQGHPPQAQTGEEEVEDEEEVHSSDDEDEA